MPRAPKLHQPAAGHYAFESSPSPLWNTFPPGTTVNTSHEKTIVSFPSKSAMTLGDYIKSKHDSLPYIDAQKLLTSLVRQLMELQHQHGLLVPLYTPNAVVVIDGGGYVADPAILESLEDGKIHFKGSVEHVPFIPPEVSSSKSASVLVPGSAYYTLASLIGATMFPSWPQRASRTDHIALLEPIITTSLYWCLLRCLEEDPTQRVFLYL
jgi:hypothetical protein